jgi:hypothetical protein
LNRLLNWFWRTIDEFFCLLQPKADNGANFSDVVDFTVSRSVKMTSNSVFSSLTSAAALATGIATAATGVLALMPHFSSQSLTHRAISKTDWDLTN